MLLSATLLSLLTLTTASKHEYVHRSMRHAGHDSRAATYCDTSNPFNGRQITPDPFWVNNMNGAYDSFIADGNQGNATKVRSIQQQGATFFWASNMKMLARIDDGIAAARAQKKATGKPQIVGVVVYNIPGRDCSAGESSGELSADDAGLARYKNEYIASVKSKFASATDVRFVVTVEPDALANALTSTAAGCVKAKTYYEEAISYAISQLQFPHVSLYLDAGNSGWLGKNTEQYAQEAAKILAKARTLNSNSKLRGFSTNIANYNPLQVSEKHPGKNDATKPADESTYINKLSPLLEAQGLPSRFIVDQGRVAMKGVTPGTWCNASPASFGPLPGTVPGVNSHVDSIMWIKPPGNSDGQCGFPGAPGAGTFFVDYVKMLVINADF